MLGEHGEDIWPTSNGSLLWGRTSRSCISRLFLWLLRLGLLHFSHLFFSLFRLVSMSCMDVGGSWLWLTRLLSNPQKARMVEGGTLDQIQCNLPSWNNLSLNPRISSYIRERERENLFTSRMRIKSKIGHNLLTFCLMILAQILSEFMSSCQSSAWQVLGCLERKIETPRIRH